MKAVSAWQETLPTVGISRQAEKIGKSALRLFSIFAALRAALI